MSTTATRRQQTREFFFQTWKKYQDQLALDPLEKQLIQLINMHPEYHEVLNHPETYQQYDFGNDNPFLHLGLHLSMLEQVTTNRPKGITAVYHDLVKNLGDAHHAEHHMMEILADLVWQATQTSNAVDDKMYLKQLKKLLKKGCTHHH